MEVFWFWFLIVLLLVVVFAWPGWPYTRDVAWYRRGGGWSYAASGTAALLALLLALLFWLGLLSITVPFAVAT